MAGALGSESWDPGRAPRGADSAGNSTKNSARTAWNGPGAQAAAQLTANAQDQQQQQQLAAQHAQVNAQLRPVAMQQNTMGSPAMGNPQAQVMVRGPQQFGPQHNEQVGWAVPQQLMNAPTSGHVTPHAGHLSGAVTPHAGQMTPGGPQAWFPAPQYGPPPGYSPAPSMGSWGPAQHNQWQPQWQPQNPLQMSGTSSDHQPHSPNWNPSAQPTPAGAPPWGTTSGMHTPMGYGQLLQAPPQQGWVYTPQGWQPTGAMTPMGQMNPMTGQMTPMAHGGMTPMGQHAMVGPQDVQMYQSGGWAQQGAPQATAMGNPAAGQPTVQRRSSGVFGDSTKGCCEQLIDTVEEFAAQWFGAFHLQHVEAEEEEEENDAEHKKKDPSLTKAKAHLRKKQKESNNRWERTGKLVDKKKMKKHRKDVQSGAIPADQEPEDMTSRQHRPFFSCGQILLVFLLWTICSLKNGTEMGGFESIWPGKTDLSVQKDCVDYRHEVWRWWTYQFTHVNFMHVAMNCVMVLVFGVSLEGFHGPLVMFAMFNLGVFGGACAFLVSDVHTSVVGMSGGCYAIIGMHFGDLVMNCKEHQLAAKNFQNLDAAEKDEAEELWKKMVVSPTKKLVVLIGFIAVDLIQYHLTQASGTSHSAHVGGFVAGFLACIVIGENLVVRDYEMYYWGAALFTGVVLVLFCVSWNMSWPPMDIFEQERWCWGRQVRNTTIFGDGSYHCVRCAPESPVVEGSALPACIAKWSLQKYIAPVSDRACQSIGGWSITES